MSELYKKLINGEININYLSPIDLINLTDYLLIMKTNYKDLLNSIKKYNYELEIQKNHVINEIKNIEEQ